MDSSVRYCLHACFPEAHLQKPHGHAALLWSPLPHPAPPHCHLPCLQVLVLRLQTVGTVEERVVGVASDKAQLADRSITGGWRSTGSCCRSGAEWWLMGFAIACIQAQSGAHHPYAAPIAGSCASPLPQ